MIYHGDDVYVGPIFHECMDGRELGIDACYSVNICYLTCTQLEKAST